MLSAEPRVVLLLPSYDGEPLGPPAILLAKRIRRSSRSAGSNLRAMRRSLLTGGSV